MHAVIRERRRAVVRVAVVVYGLLALTACIFDRSTYEGGGRADQGGSQTAETGSATTTATSTATTTATTTATAIVDAGTTG